jgi:AraC-like DNA-binding protein
MTREAPSPERLSFDTEVLPPDERMDRYRALYGIGAEVEATGPAPRVTFEGWRLDRAIIYDRRLNDIGHYRSETELDRYGMSHWTVTLVIEGWIAFDLGTGFRQIRPGEILLVDVSAPGRNDTRQARVATLSIAQDRLEEIIGPLDGLHGLVLAAEDCRLYADFVGSLLANLPTMSSRALAAATSAMGTLLAIALEKQGRHDAIAAPSRESARLTQIRALVDARLRDPDFGPDAAIEESGLSRATLYRLLRPQHGLAAFIQRRRLERIRSCLSDPLDQRPFAAVAAAAGFHDDGQANRAFVARYGIRPGAYRAATSGGEPIEQFRTWQEDLR